MKKPKTKTHTFWCVVEPRGNILVIFTARYWRKDSINAFMKGSRATTWRDAKITGFTCKKFTASEFTITTKIK